MSVQHEESVITEWLQVECYQKELSKHQSLDDM